MALRQVQKNWFGTAVGLRMDPDKHYDLQCVDVADHYAEAIFPGVRWQDSIGGVAGAKDMLRTANPNYFEIIYNASGNPYQLPEPGDILVWGGNPYNQWGHTAVQESVAKLNGATVIQQNSNGLANQAAHKMFMGWYGAGTGMLTGWLRPRADKMPKDPAPAAKSKLLTVTANVAVVRTEPKISPATVAKKYPNGIAKGAKIAAVGFVAGQDPYPLDGKTDNAWVKTVSGYYIWANAVGNNLAGLRKL